MHCAEPAQRRPAITFCRRLEVSDRGSVPDYSLGKHARTVGRKTSLRRRGVKDGGSASDNRAPRTIPVSWCASHSRFVGFIPRSTWANGQSHGDLRLLL